MKKNLDDIIETGFYEEYVETIPSMNAEWRGRFEAAWHRADKVLGDDRASWFMEVHRQLDGLTPLQACKTVEGVQRVMDALESIEHGNLA